MLVCGGGRRGRRGKREEGGKRVKKNISHCCIAKANSVAEEIKMHGGYAISVAGDFLLFIYIFAHVNYILFYYEIYL
jgi:hypothetical protein